MKKIVLFLLTLVCVVVFTVACGETVTTTTDGTTTLDDNTTTAAVSTTKAPDSTTGAAIESEFESIKIANNDLSAYTIVYAESHLAEDAAATPQYYPVWDFNKETAERLSDLIFDVTGVRLSIACDVDTAETDKEILIGKTNRTVTETLSLAKVKVEEYKICVSGEKLVICGGKYGSTWHAIDYIEELFANELANKNTNYNFASDMTYTGQFDFIRIGCIGDSITQGVGVSNPNKYAYSAQLERWLWKDAIVYNLGNSGKTLRDDLSDSYMKTPTYKKALMIAADIDIFTVMLGTNDSNRDQNWSAADTATYKKDYETLFRTLSEKNSDMQFVIMNCPACFGTRIDKKFGSPELRQIQEELVGEMNEKGYKTSFFDMYSVTKDLQDYYPDNLHPDEDGHTVMAEELANALSELIDGMK